MMWLAHLFFLWGLKDYVKERLRSKKQSVKWVETEIDNDLYLAICADVANKIKHGDYDKDRRAKTRSGSFPTLGILKCTIPTEVLSLVFFKSTIDVVPKNIERIIFSMPILNCDDQYIGDAFEYINYACTAWEKIIEKAEVIIESANMQL